MTVDYLVNFFACRLKQAVFLLSTSFFAWLKKPEYIVFCLQISDIKQYRKLNVEKAVIS